MNNYNGGVSLDHLKYGARKKVIDRASACIERQGCRIRPQVAFWSTVGPSGAALRNSATAALFYIAHIKNNRLAWMPTFGTMDEFQLAERVDEQGIECDFCYPCALMVCSYLEKIHIEDDYDDYGTRPAPAIRINPMRCVRCGAILDYEFTREGIEKQAQCFREHGIDFRCRNQVHAVHCVLSAWPAYDGLWDDIRDVALMVLEHYTGKRSARSCALEEVFDTLW